MRGQGEVSLSWMKAEVEVEGWDEQEYSRPACVKVLNWKRAWRSLGTKSKVEVKTGGEGIITDPAISAHRVHKLYRLPGSLLGYRGKANIQGSGRPCVRSLPQIPLDNSNTEWWLFSAADRLLEEVP